MKFTMPNPLQVQISIVPPGGGEVDHEFSADLHALPRAGDFVAVARPGNSEGDALYVVRKVWWRLSPLGARPANPSTMYVAERIVVECEPDSDTDLLG